MAIPLFVNNFVRHAPLNSRAARCCSASAKMIPFDNVDSADLTNNIELRNSKIPICIAAKMYQNERGRPLYFQVVRAKIGPSKQSRRKSCAAGGAIAGKNIIFVAGLGCIGMDTSREIMKKGPKNLVILDTVCNPKGIQELQQLNRNLKVTYYAYDVTAPLDVSKKLLARIFKRFKKIDLLINGAGILDDHKMEKTIAVNFTGTVNTTTAIMDFWDKRKGGPGGVVANICSVTAFNPIYQVPVYCASKCAAFSYTYSLAKLTPITGISAYSINPGITRTTLVQKFNSWLDVEPCTPELLLAYPTQTTQQAGKSFVKAIEANKNGAIWKLDLGKLEEVKWEGHKHWSSGI